ELEEEVASVLEHIWESPTPSKVIAFSWQLHYDRIPTRRNLEARDHEGIREQENPSRIFVDLARYSLVYLEGTE
ncbi:hypothetical protein L195_g043380, partial [Trifolium pratense]